MLSNGINTYLFRIAAICSYTVVGYEPWLREARNPYINKKKNVRVMYIHYIFLSMCQNLEHITTRLIQLSWVCNFDKHLMCRCWVCKGNQQVRDREKADDLVLASVLDWMGHPFYGAGSELHRVLKVIIWSAYMLADTTAVFALGHMSPEHHLVALSGRRCCWCTSVGRTISLPMPLRTTGCGCRSSADFGGAGRTCLPSSPTRRRGSSVGPGRHAHVCGWGSSQARGKDMSVPVAAYYPP